MGAEGFSAIELEDWHYAAQRRLFAEEIVVTSDMTLIAAGPIPEPEWNHVGRLRLGAEPLETALARAWAFLDARGRRRVVVLTPHSEPAALAPRLRALGLQPVFEHDWLVWGQDRAPTPRCPAGVAVEPIADRSELEAMIKVFEGVYQDGTLSPGYGQALRRSFAAEGVTHYLARLRGRPVGAATTVRVGPAAALYNLAVRDEARGLGIGRLLTDLRVAQALEEGAQVAFLQTEAASVARWQQASGFVAVFTATGFGETERARG